MPGAIPAREQRFKPFNTKAVMITKTINPIIDANIVPRIVIGTRIEYRLFGLLIYRKTMFTPEKYGIAEYEFNYRI